MTNPFPIPNLSIIAAVAQNNALGKDNDLIWHISDDLKHFKALTSGHSVVMGRNTWNSLYRKPLPNRRNIVLTHDDKFCEQGAEVAHSVSQVFEMVAGEEETFIMGGAAVYREFMPFVKKMYITWVWKDFDADVFFPTIDLSLFSKTHESEKYSDEKTGLTFSYADYYRSSNPFLNNI